MPNKTIQKKTATKKVVKHKKFDLSVNTKDQASDIINSLKSLQADRGWIFLKQIFEGNIAVLEQAIMLKVDPDDGKTVLTEDQCDRLRDKRSYLVELLNKPNSIIEGFKISQTPETNYDPYDSVPTGKG